MDSASEPQLRREWEEVRSRLHESGHRLNSRYARQKYAGRNLDPQKALQYLTNTYERTAAMAVKTVTDHESALACIEELDIFLKKMLKLSSRLLREMLPRESRTTSQALCSEFRRRLLPRSEHWKAEAHKLARRAERANRSRVRTEQTVTSEDQAAHFRSSRGAAQPESRPVAPQILCAAMERHGLNAPKLAVKIRAILKRKRETRPKVDRTTVYRILKGETRKPHPAIRNGLIEALQLEGEEAAAVRHELSGTEHTPASQSESRRN